ncbi:MAG: rod shape-determining protein [Clostridiales bacterium]|nr:rod shape-determining protein [Clostridiales bacterium]
MTQIAIELGTSNTTVFLSGNGIVLSEPSVVAYSGAILRASGQRAKEMLGRAPEKTAVVCPIDEGVIADPAAAALMLGDFLGRVIDRRVFPGRIRALLAVPCGLTADERRDFEGVLLQCGVGEAVLVEKAICAAHGMGLPIQSPKGCFVADIGGGTADIAVISLSGIVEGCSICLGTKFMDRAVGRFVLEKHNLEIGPLSAEKLRESVGSLYENDVSTLTVNGTNCADKSPDSATVESRAVSRAVAPYYRRIAEAAESVINRCPPEICAQVLRSGINLCGGGALITGLEDYIRNVLKLPATVFPDAPYAVISGAGKLLGDRRLLADILNQN